MESAKLKATLRLGLWVLIILIALTVVEYGLALLMDSGNLLWMVIMNIIDAGLILYYFMHIAELWQQEE